jgi:hypothetical protein
MPGKYASYGVAVSYKDPGEVSDFQPRFCKCKCQHVVGPELQAAHDAQHARAKSVVANMVASFEDLLPGEWARLDSCARTHSNLLSPGTSHPGLLAAVCRCSRLSPSLIFGSSPPIVGDRH